RGIANSKIGFGDLILLLRYFFKLKVSTHPNEDCQENFVDRLYCGCTCWANRIMRLVVFVVD
ncbi:MAG: hypothetical protein EKK63_00670, partial [Acinetobacter sp.]